MIWDCPKNKKLVVRGSKDDNVGDRQKPRAQRRVFVMTRRNTLATFDVLIRTLKFTIYLLEF